MGETQVVPVTEFPSEDADSIPVIQEDGDWKICDTSLAEGMQPGNKRRRTSLNSFTIGRL